MLRLVRQAHDAGRAVAAVTYGQTRADDLWAVKAQTMLGPTLAAVAEALAAA
jgi:hypothetical protein